AASIAATVIPGRLSTPSAARACAITGRAESPMLDPIFSARSARMTRGLASGSAARRDGSRAGISAATTIPVSPAPTPSTGAPPGGGRRRGEGGEMRAQPQRRVVGVDIERMLAEPRDGWPDQPAAEGEHQAIVGQLESLARCNAGRRSIGDAQVRDLRHLPLH